MCDTFRLSTRVSKPIATDRRYLTRLLGRCSERVIASESGGGRGFGFAAVSARYRCCRMVAMAQAAPPQTESAGLVARRFLELLQAEKLDQALSLLDERVVYSNVSLPTVHGRDAVGRLFRPLLGRMGFRVHFHATGIDEADPGVALTERTDALVFGPVSVQFWVYGRFEVRDGRITLWRDSFDWRDMLMGMVRGVVGVALPFVRRTWPTNAGT